MAQVFRLTDSEAEETFRQVRWAETKGEATCPHCGGVDAYECRRPNGSLRYRCRACGKDFTLTSGTLFSSHKLPLRTYLAAIALFINECKGKNALALSRDLGIAYKSAFVLCHKLREALAGELKDRVIGGSEEVAETDGAFFGGYVRPSNLVENRRDRRLPQNQSGKRKCVVIVRERDGNSVPAVFKSESHAANFIKARVAPGTKLNADQAAAWDTLHKNFEVARIDHGQAYSLNGACVNWAESYFSRLRRAEAGHHHHISGPYLLRYAQEASWREDNRRKSNGNQVKSLAALAMTRKPSVDFSGYWQRHISK